MPLLGEAVLEEVQHRFPRRLALLIHAIAHCVQCGCELRCSIVSQRGAAHHATLAAQGRTELSLNVHLRCAFKKCTLKSPHKVPAQGPAQTTDGAILSK